MAAKKERRLEPEVERTVTALRAAGMPERSIYEGLRRNLKEAPSYRDIRAAFDRAGLKTRHEATERRRAGFEIAVGPEGSERMKATHYRDKLGEIAKAVKEGYLARGMRGQARALLDDQFIVGYGYRAGVDVDQLKDDAPILAVVEDIERGEGSP